VRREAGRSNLKKVAKEETCVNKPAGDIYKGIRIRDVRREAGRSNLKKVAKEETCVNEPAGDTYKGNQIRDVRREAGRADLLYINHWTLFVSTF
jgi:hypothetical protein